MAFQVRYSRTEMILHRMAFSGNAIQMTASDIEDMAFRKAYANFKHEKPIFITSLARAGTTLLLESLNSLPEVASHTYRDMPFLLSPILWAKLSSRFYVSSKKQERAHGDGIEIGFDSPESFEEVFWKAFWSDHYRNDEIGLWTDRSARNEATAFMRRHMQKIVALRCPDNIPTGRYLSKNNTNIARLVLLPKMIPDSFILLVLRNPLEHATSLLRQHLNFLKMHAENTFVRRYMADIGHYEFGELHKRIRFPGVEATGSDYPTTSLNYWLQYWIHAFNYVLEISPQNCQIISYDHLCERPISSCEALLASLDLPLEGTQLVAAKMRPVVQKANLDDFDPGLVNEARSIHAELLDRGILAGH